MEDKKFTFYIEDYPLDVVQQIDKILRDRFGIKIETIDGDPNGLYHAEIKIDKIKNYGEK